MIASKAFVLIRTSLTSVGACTGSKRYEYFKECLNSVLNQSFDDIVILLLQDTRTALSRRVEKTLPPRFCADILNNWSKLTGAKRNRELHFYRANCNGPALALYYLRKELNFLKPEPNDVVILLDDDDFLVRESAVKDIVDKMTKGASADVCLLSYNIVGDSSLDISNGAGYIHNNLIKGLDGKYKSVNDYVSSEDPARWLSLADSLGWTKAYKYSIVKRYMDALFEYFNFDESRLIRFYRKNNAYEDFPDIINICWSGVKVTGCKEPTHAYRKTKSSITANPRLGDFIRKRPAYLSLLIGLVQNAGMTEAANATIARYVVIKLILIENIMAKFRNEGVSHNVFRNLTERAYFFKCFTESLIRDGNILHFAELLMGVSLYKKAIKSCQNPESIIKEAASAEVKLCCVDVQQCIREDVLASDKPIKKYKRRIKVTFAVSIILLLCICGALFYFFKDSSQNREVPITAVVGIMSALIAYLGNLLVGYYTKRDKDSSARSIYKNELKDMVRHLYANLNVLLQIKRELGEYIAPAEIHFINLKIPQNSVLLSDEPIKDIMINELDTIARIKVNIRNINNSADYLCSLVRNKSQYDVEIMRTALEWEITRYVGYIINLLYVLDDPSFRFPQNKEQLRRYMNIKGVIETMAKEICGINNSKVKEEYSEDEVTSIVDLLAKKYQKYVDDREIKRSVLFN